MNDLENQIKEYRAQVKALNARIYELNEELVKQNHMKYNEAYGNEINASYKTGFDVFGFPSVIIEV